MKTAEKIFSVRLPVTMHSRLEQLTKTTGRTKSFLAVEAIESYLSQQAWQIAEVESGVKEADRGEFATDQEIKALFAKYAN